MRGKRDIFDLGPVIVLTPRFRRLSLVYVVSEDQGQQRSGWLTCGVRGHVTGFGRNRCEFER